MAPSLILGQSWYGPLGLIFEELVLILLRGKFFNKIKNRHTTKWEFKPKDLFHVKRVHLPLGYTFILAFFLAHSSLS